MPKKETPETPPREQLEQELRRLTAAYIEARQCEFLKMGGDCFTCRFFVRYDYPLTPEEEFSGECRRRAPQAVTGKRAGWPVVQVDDCCGEYVEWEPEKTTKTKQKQTERTAKE